MKKWIVIGVFIVGLTIFSYPIISNMLSTKEHHTMVSDYSEKVKEMKEKQLALEKEKAVEHNKRLSKSEVDFVDPFSNQKPGEEASGNKSYYDALHINPSMGNIEIPKINVKIPIYHGTSDEVLSKGVGHLENSSLPSGELGVHSVLTAHRGLPSSKLFRNLDKLVIGDQFYIQVLDETLTYEVHDINIVLPHETDWLKINEEENIVTLLTCEPYMINTHRMLVSGHLVNNEDMNALESEPINASDRNNSHVFRNVVIGLIIISTLITVWQVWQRKKGGRSNENK